MQVSKKLQLSLRRAQGRRLRGGLLAKVSAAIKRTVTEDDLATLEDTDRAWGRLAEEVTRRVPNGYELAVEIHDSEAILPVQEALLKVDSGSRRLLMFRPGSEYVGGVHVRFEDVARNLFDLADHNGLSVVVGDLDGSHGVVVEVSEDSVGRINTATLVIWPSSWVTPVKAYLRTLPASAWTSPSSPPSLNRTVFFDAPRDA